MPLKIITYYVNYILYCHVSFSASIRLMICSLKIVLLIPLKYHTGNRNCRLLELILLRLNLEVHIFHCSSGGRLAALVDVCIVWNMEPLASGGQSGHKLIPLIICQFLCAREKNWIRTYSTRDQVPVCPVFTRAKIKSRLGILKNLLSQYILYIQYAIDIFPS